jgi:hypothetical protein
MATNRYWSVAKVRKQRYQYRAIGRDRSYFDKNLSKSNNKYKQDEIIQMLDYVVLFSGRVFQQTIDERLGRTLGSSCDITLFVWTLLLFIYLINHSC